MLVNVPGRKKKGKEGLPPHLQFVESVRVRRQPLSRRQLLLGGFWGLMVVKCVVAHWVIIAWNLPVGPFWVWMPSMAAAATCTFALCTCE
jgi:hypothetical protein